MRSPTIRDVARHAGVGVGTVSRVLNNSVQVSDATRQRVEEAIRALNFQPNRAARQLPRRTAQRLVGVLLPFFAYNPFVERLRGVQAALEAAGDTADLILFNVSHPDRIEAQVQSIIGPKRVDGLLIITINLTSRQLASLTNANIPLVGIYDRATHLMPCVAIDNVAGAALAVSHLVDLGHERIAYVGDSFPDPYGFPTSEDRLAGYNSALSACGIAIRPEYIRLGAHGERTAHHLTHELLALPARPTAIFAMSDMQAFGALAAAREHGLRVPDDISVIGFDDIELSQHIGLTTVRQHLRESGSVGMARLLQYLDQNTTQAAPVMPNPVLVARATTSRPPHRSHLT